jgi:hypothetical protein
VGDLGAAAVLHFASERGCMPICPVRESRWDIRGALTSVPTHSEPFQGPVQRKSLKSGVY